ncbi:MAG: hypothetical protein Q8N56_02705 [bacterium]|nr:hypothetical protein [bacterium]
MFGPIFIIVGFVICLIGSEFVCRTRADCDTGKKGMGMMISAVVFVAIVIILRHFTGSR